MPNKDKTLVEEPESVKRIKKEQGGMVDDMRPQYQGGGKVEGGGLFNFPSKDSRNG